MNMNADRYNRREGGASLVRIAKATFFHSLPPSSHQRKRWALSHADRKLPWKIKNKNVGGPPRNLPPLEKEDFFREVRFISNQNLAQSPEKKVRGNLNSW